MVLWGPVILILKRQTVAKSDYESCSNYPFSRAKRLGNVECGWTSEGVHPTKGQEKGC